MLGEYEPVEYGIISIGNDQISTHLFCRRHCIVLASRKRRRRVTKALQGSGKMHRRRRRRRRRRLVAGQPSRRDYLKDVVSARVLERRKWDLRPFTFIGCGPGRTSEPFGPMS